jgi:hypothetical protein
MSRFRRGLARWGEVMSGECSGCFGTMQRRSVGFVLRKKKAGQAGRAC